METTFGAVEVVTSTKMERPAVADLLSPAAQAPAFVKPLSLHNGHIPTTVTSSAGC